MTDPGYDPARLRPKRKTRIASWPQIRAALAAYGTFYEVTDLELSPWPNDPDGGEARLIGLLRKIVEMAVEVEQHDHQTINTTALRLLFSRELEDRE